jgi:hypothetical protein
MDTLIVGALLGLVISLITGWLTARVNKSTDTRTQLLIKIDDYANELNNVYQSGLQVLIDSSFVFIEWSKDFYRILNPHRWNGVAEALGNNELIIALDDYHSKHEVYYTVIQSIAEINTKQDYSNEDQKKLDDKYIELENVASELGSKAERVHRLIAKEMLRILPSWPERVWLWIKSKV